VLFRSNLWPFELVFALVIGFAVAHAGAWLAKAARTLIAGDDDQGEE
jgi:hypothetical protein